ncbi:MAG: signal peptidase II [Candidatus Latescibacteria bacterium]|nr:signal peptidase II [Candidatus Latescibacterota bacterium]
MKRPSLGVFNLGVRSLGAPWLLAPLLLAVDFVTKRLVLANAERLTRPVEVLGDVARFAYVRNPGAAMGLPLGGRGFLIGVSLLAAVVLALLYRRTDPRQRLRRGALAAILGGALGNLVDRIFYGGLVVDFIDLGIGAHRFYTFNVADMGVTLGGAVLFFSLWREDRSAGAGRAATAGPATAGPVAADDPAANVAAADPAPGPSDPGHLDD